MKKRLSQRGFTLIELAIVMVIIGLLVGAVLKGQAMIDDAKQRRLLNDLQEISAAYFTYYDRYSAIPGDDASNHGWVGVTGSATSDGFITGTAVPDPAGESQEAWQALRYAGLISGDPAATGTSSLPDHPFEGKYGFSNMNFGAEIGIKNYIHVDDIAGSVAEIIDIKYDDGVYNTGSVRASGAYTTETVDLYYAL